MKTFVTFLLLVVAVDASRRSTVHNGRYDHPPTTIAGPWGLPPTKTEPEKVKDVKRVVKPKKVKCDDEHLPFGCHSVHEVEEVCCGME
jgi:hypothetical protein